MKLMQQAQERNARLYLPVRWTSGFKSVISGLTENSSGNGINRRTVIHVLLLEDIRDGRWSEMKGIFFAPPQVEVTASFGLTQPPIVMVSTGLTYVK
jgi:hypothetical protein